MQRISFPDKSEWANILKRPYTNNKAVLDSVQEIIADVKRTGDVALKKFAQHFDGVALDNLHVAEDELVNAEKIITPELKDAIQHAKQNIEMFHRAQQRAPQQIETAPGVWCWQKNLPIQKVGLYIPGGTAPLFSTVLMLGVPAQLAGCSDIILCSPVGKSGGIHPAVLYAAHCCGIKKIYKTGGAQAIAAMAYGTETIPAVYKIFGPGNQYVTAAKQLVQLDGVAIDMPAGPSEVCVLADDTANAAFVASDLLSQAEHGRDSQVLLLSTSEKIITDTLAEVELQTARLPRRETVTAALQNSKAILVETIKEATDIINEYAPEHLILACADAEVIAEKITAAGSVFIGPWSPESAGDYASGTNHTLPTNAFARAYSGVSLDSFYKKTTFQKLTQHGLQSIAQTVITMAEAEGLEAHAEAVRVRLRNI